MKTQRFWLGTALAIAGFALATVLMSSRFVETKFQQTVKISGNATSKDVVPTVTGNATATITGTYDPSTNVLTYTTNWKDLSGAPTNGGFYIGAPGSSGTALGDAWTMGSDLKNNGTYSGTIKLTPEQAKQLTTGQVYYTLGTSANNGGEVRGQISAKP